MSLEQKKEIARTTAREHLLGQIAATPTAHGILPYLSRSYLFFFMVGTNMDAENQLKQWGVPLPDGKVTYINAHTAEMFISTGGEQETLAYAVLRQMLKTAMDNQGQQPFCRYCAGTGHYRPYKSLVLFGDDEDDGSLPRSPFDRADTWP